jgi:hypothetical protein
VAMEATMFTGWIYDHAVCLPDGSVLLYGAWGPSSSAGKT